MYGSKFSFFLYFLFVSSPSSSLTSAAHLLLHSSIHPSITYHSHHPSSTTLTTYHPPSSPPTTYHFHHPSPTTLTTHHSTPISGNLDDTIDVDGLSLNDLRQSKSVKSISTAQYARMDALEHSRRALLKELQNAKISLETVFKTESFNDSTGVCICVRV